MELILDKKNNHVFLYDGELGEKVWEPEPITRFEFKNPIEDDWLKEQLSANRPTAGIIFDGQVYIGTNDGIIYTPEIKIQRIPEILVDPEVFLDRYPYVTSSPP